MSKKEDGERKLSQAYLAEAAHVSVAEIQRIKREEPARYVALLQAALRGRI